MNDFMAIAGHQKPAHTVSVTLMDKFDAVRPSVPSWIHARRDKTELLKLPKTDAATLLSAEISSATASNVISLHQHVNIMKM